MSSFAETNEETAGGRAGLKAVDARIEGETRTFGSPNRNATLFAQAKEAATHVHPFYDHRATRLLEQVENLSSAQSKAVVSPTPLERFWAPFAQVKTASAAIELLPQFLKSGRPNGEQCMARRFTAYYLAQEGMFRDALQIADAILIKQFKLEALVDIAEFQYDYGHRGEALLTSTKAKIILDIEQDPHAPKQTNLRTRIANIQNALGDGEGAARSLIGALYELKNHVPVHRP